KRWSDTLTVTMPIVLNGGKLGSSWPGPNGAVVASPITLNADSLFDFDPTIDPRATAMANAQNIEFATRTRLNGCGAVALSGTTLTVSFSSSWCVLRGGAQVAGSVTATVTKVGPQTLVALAFNQVTVNGRSLAGTATFATADGSTFTVTADLTSGSRTISIPASGLTVVGATSAMTLTGGLAVSDGTTSTAVTFSSLHYTLGQCYPDGGSVTLARGTVTETITFSARSATTGEVTVSRGRRTFVFTLPRYGSCPAA
ncbi:MAG: hypothetical protein WCJ30_03270, partial [Deltaproteobacteria bacterium]